MGVKVMSISSLQVFATPTLGLPPGIFDVVEATVGCSNISFNPHYLPLKPKRTGVHLVGHKQLAWTYIATASVASNNVENSRTGAPK